MEKYEGLEIEVVRFEVEDVLGDNEISETGF